MWELQNTSWTDAAESIFFTLSSLRFPGNFPISSGICFMLKIYWVITNLYLLCYLSFWLMVKFALMIHYETLSKWSQLLVSSDSKIYTCTFFLQKRCGGKSNAFTKFYTVIIHFYSLSTLIFLPLKYHNFIRHYNTFAKRPIEDLV